MLARNANALTVLDVQVVLVMYLALVVVELMVMELVMVALQEVEQVLQVLQETSRHLRCTGAAISGSRGSSSAGPGPQWSSHIPAASVFSQLFKARMSLVLGVHDSSPYEGRNCS
jgi:hypothetical protein